MFLYRKATFADVDEIHDLIAVYAAQGLMLPKPHSTLYETLREFVVAEEIESKKIVGVGALHLTWNELAEDRLGNRQETFGGRSCRRSEGIFHADLSPGLFPIARFHDDDKRIIAAQNLERMYRVPEVPELRRNRNDSILMRNVPKKFSAVFQTGRAEFFFVEFFARDKFVGSEVVVGKIEARSLRGEHHVAETVFG